MLGSRNGSFVLGSHYELLGVVSGFYHEDSNLTLTTASTYTGMSNRIAESRWSFRPMHSRTYWKALH